MEEDVVGGFEFEDVGDGDEFMAVLPWKGAIWAPSNPPDIVNAPPPMELEMDFVFGVKTEEVRQNIHFNP